MPVLESTVCNRCKNKTDMWLDRNEKGFPNYQGIVCGVCGSVNCILKDWDETTCHALIPPPEDGEIHRFEYSYTNENGKRINKKMSPQDVKKHYENNQKRK